MDSRLGARDDGGRRAAAAAAATRRRASSNTSRWPISHLIAFYGNMSMNAELIEKKSTAMVEKGPLVPSVISVMA